MKNILKVIPLVYLLGAGVQIYAQENTFWTVSYSTALPLGEFKDKFIEDFSFRGFQLDGQKMLSDKLSVGGSVGYQVFRMETEKEYTEFINTEDYELRINGKQFRYVNAFPIMAGSRYYVKISPQIRAFAGAGLGAYYIRKRVAIGATNFNDESWHFGLMPEFGGTITISDNLGISPAIRYNHAFKSSETITYNYLTFSLGITFQE